VLSFFFPWLGDLPEFFFWGMVLLTFIRSADAVPGKGCHICKRHAPERLSNSDDNELGIYIENRYSFSVAVGIIDEIPVQFQKRDVWFKTSLKAGEHKLISYLLRPLKRGEYEFGSIRVFVRSPLGLVSRRFNFEQAETLPVYPSFLQMRKYELMAISNRLTRSA
jgi:uncharacterized protein (DUF58 family)